MVPDEVQEAKVLYARARAWPLSEPLQRAEPKWRKPGDVEAAFFALYDVLRSQMKARSRRDQEEPTRLAAISDSCWPVAAPTDASE